MDVARARYLTSSRGREALAALPAALAVLSINQLAATLRRHHPAAEAAALAEQVTLRARAVGRLREPERWLLTADGLEMMTHPLVAERRARRIATIGLPVADLTTGLGGDLAEVAACCPRTTGLENVRGTALLAQANVPLAAIVQGDARRPPFDISRHLVLIDPSRRADGSRRFDPDAFSPAWREALSVVEAAPAGVMKAPPGLDHRYIPAEAEAEFVQVGRSMREAALWMGRGAAPGLRRAVLLREREGDAIELDSNAPQAPDSTAAVGTFIFDPESCVTRAGLVRQLGERIGGQQLDPQTAYLSGNVAKFDPLCATFEVLDVIHFSLARLKRHLRERKWRPDEVRRRAFPIDPDELLRQLGRLEGEPVALLLTTINGERTVVMARRATGDRAKL